MDTDLAASPLMDRLRLAATTPKRHSVVAKVEPIDVDTDSHRVPDHVCRKSLVSIGAVRLKA